MSKPLDNESEGPAKNITIRVPESLRRSLEKLPRGELSQKTREFWESLVAPKRKEVGPKVR